MKRCGDRWWRDNGKKADNGSHDSGVRAGEPYFGYNYLVARIEKLVFQMEANSIAFMDILNQPVQK